jgi:CHAT domain-containing protein
MAVDPATQREYGLAENQHVLAALFNPKHPFHENYEYIEETAENACDQARRAFGADDPIYLDARINAGLYFAYRRRDYAGARTHLDEADAVAARLRDPNPALIAKLLTTRGITALIAGTSVSKALTDRVPVSVWLRPESGGPDPGVSVFRALAAAVSASGHQVLSYLLWNIGLPFVYDLLAGGHRTEAFAVLRGEVLANAVAVWGADSPDVERINAESRWLGEASVDQPPLPDALLRRFRKRIGAALGEKPPDPTIPARLHEAVDRFHERTREIVSAPDDGLRQAIPRCENSIRALFEALEAEGLYTEIMSQTDSFISAATRHFRDEETDLFEGLSPDERDRRAVAKPGEVHETPIQAIEPSQACVSREHLAWIVYGIGTQASDAANRTARLVVIPALEVLANLYEIASQRDKQAQSVELRKLALRVSHAIGGDTNDTVHRLRVRLAQALFDHGEGDWGDILRAVLTHTDSLEFSDKADPYDAALGKALRASAYWLRESINKQIAPWPVDDKSSFMDLVMAESVVRDVMEVFDEDNHPLERAQVLYSRVHALLTKGPSLSEPVQPGDEGEDDSDEESEPDADLLFCLHALERADFAFGPVHFSERWVDIQILKARISAIAARRGIDVPETVLDVLRRAKALLSHIGPGLLHLRLDTALAAAGRQDARSLVLAEDARGPPGYYHKGRYDQHALAELCERANALFTESDFTGAVPLLETALRLAERLFARGASAKSLRLVAYQIGEVTRRLAYCHHSVGNFTRAAGTLESGKARMMLAALEPELIDWRGVSNDVRAQAEALFVERQQLLARSESAMAYVEDIDRIGAIQAELDILIPDRGAALRVRCGAFENLTSAPPGAITALPLITEHGSAVYMIRGGAKAVTETDVVALPELTTADLRSWLNGGETPGWLAVYKNRNRSRIDRHRFRTKIVEISGLLRQHLMAPVCHKAKADGYSSLILIPTSGLQILPVHAATSADLAAGETVLDGFSFRTIPSATIFRLLLNRAGETPTKRGLVVGVGEYELAAWGDLQCARIEAEIVADEIGVTPLLDEAVTPEKLAQDSGGAEYLHIACHGSSWATDPNFFSGFRPRPVLILRSAGVSTATIQANWNLRGTRLVCLSGCDTGLVDLNKPWDEFEGISNILLCNGARAVLASLWSVDDKSTALLMARFYRSMANGGMPPSEALRDAQTWLRSATAADLRSEFPAVFRDDPDSPLQDDGLPPFGHPYYWAPFVLNG